MMHDLLVKRTRSLKPPGIGRLIYQAFHVDKEFGATEDGVTQQIRRLLKKRSNYLSNPNRLLGNLPDTPSSPNRLHPARRDK